MQGKAGMAQGPIIERRRPTADVQRRVASPIAGGGPASEEDEVALVITQLDGRRLALPLSHVLEVQRMVALTPLPEAPAVVEGVIDLRGQVVPVLDVRARFDLPPSTPSLSDQLVIARAGERTVAIRVGSTVGVRGVPTRSLDRTTTDIPGVAHVAGVARDDEGLLVVHDLATFLSWDEGRQLDGALTRLEAEL